MLLMTSSRKALLLLQLGEETVVLQHGRQLHRERFHRHQVDT
jgi:hypothetical protein